MCGCSWDQQDKTPDLTPPPTVTQPLAPAPRQPISVARVDTAVQAPSDVERRRPTPQPPAHDPLVDDDYSSRVSSRGPSAYPPGWPPLTADAIRRLSRRRFSRGERTRRRDRSLARLAGVTTSSPAVDRRSPEYGYYDRRRWTRYGATPPPSQPLPQPVVDLHDGSGHSFSTVVQLLFTTTTITTTTFTTTAGRGGLVVSAFDRGVRGPRFKPRRGWLYLSRRPLLGPGSVAIRCVLPVLWMTSCSHIMARNRQRKKTYSVYRGTPIDYVNSTDVSICRHSTRLSAWSLSSPLIFLQNTRCSTHTYHSRRQKFCCRRTACM